MSDLKNCPFCGTKPMESLHGHVKCCLFHCVAHKRWMTTEEWSARPTESALMAALKELRDAEWMVSHDWGGDRAAVLERVDSAIQLAGG